MNDASSYADEVESHYARIWSPPIERIIWNLGPIDELPREFCVLRMRRSAKIVAYGTRGMSQPHDEQPTELHVLLPWGDHVLPEVVEILTVVAHFHRTGAPLGIGHSVNFGQAIVPGSQCTHGLISLPYLDGPDLEWFGRVRFLWLVPITEREVSFKKTSGTHALEARFEDENFNYLDLFRNSVV